MLYALTKEKGFESMMGDYIKKTYNKDSSKALTKAEASEIIQMLQDMKQARGGLPPWPMKAGDKLSGVFQIDRVIFDNSIWNNVVEFRVFFLYSWKCSLERRRCKSRKCSRKKGGAISQVLQEFKRGLNVH